MSQGMKEEMEDTHAAPTGLRFREFAEDVTEEKTKENFDSKELTETIGKLRLRG